MKETESLSWRRDLDATTVPRAAAQGSAADVRVLGFTVLAHPDVGRVGEQAHLTALTAGRRTALSRLEPAFAQPSGGPLRPLADPHLSRRAFNLVPAAEGDGLQIRRGAAPTELLMDGLAVVRTAEIALEALDAGVTFLLGERVALLLHRLDPVPSAAGPRFGLIGESDAMACLRAAILQVADLPIPVLILGETGSGKELVAAAIHQAGPRRAGSFVAVNMGAIPASLASAEIFGTAKGGFTGADRPRRGYFQQADRGTLFLDEIGETPREIQIALLRALEDGAVRPLAADRAVSVDVRVLAATDANLERTVDEGGFSAPLLHRLGGFVIRVPPLRERREDIGRLLVYFVAQELAACAMSDRLEPARGGGRPWLPATLVARLAAFSWPGNVRQLRNAARRLVAAHRHLQEVGDDPEIDRLLADRSRSGDGGTRVESPPPSESPALRPSEITEVELVAALRQRRWRIKPTARDLGISRTTLYGLIAKFPNVQLASQLTEGEISSALERHGGDVGAAADALDVSEQGLRLRLRQLEAGG